jgi:hypothetical protein
MYPQAKSLQQLHCDNHWNSEYIFSTKSISKSTLYKSSSCETKVDESTDCTNDSDI